MGLTLDSWLQHTREHSKVREQRAAMGSGVAYAACPVPVEVTRPSSS